MSTAAPQIPPDPPLFSENDILSYYGRNLMESLNEELKSQLPVGVPRPEVFNSVLRTGEAPKSYVKALSNLPIGIVGGGAGGMYTALILDSLGLPYEILEASDRIGGRVSTYHFPEKEGQPKPGPYDYFDLGPMRFPETPIMSRLFKLFHYAPLNTGKIQLANKLIPYYYESVKGNSFRLFNNARFRSNKVPSPQSDPFKDASIGVPQAYINAGWKAIFRDVIGKFVEKLENDLKTGGTDGWKYLMGYNSTSTRGYMRSFYKPSPSLNIPSNTLPTNVINWMETNDRTTGWYDLALTTTVLEEMAFGFSTSADNPINFWCLDGGSEVLTKAMAEYIQNRTSEQGILFKKHVNAISIADPSQGVNSPMNVTVASESKPRQYSHVVSTVPFPVLRYTIDISGAKPTLFQVSSLRQLQYTPSTKYAIRFKSPWWTIGRDNDKQTLGITGGQSFTDRTVRTVVYPSYGLGSSGPAVLIASFVWTEDAARLGGLMGTGDKGVEQRLLDRVLEDLAAIHNVSTDFLQSQYLDHHAVNWTTNPLTLGAFALFGPGKFEDLYQSITSPTPNGRLHFAGEAASVRHGWIVGALGSAWRAVYELLSLSYPEKIKEFQQKWGFEQEWSRAKFARKDGELEGPSPQDNLLLEHILLSCSELFEDPQLSKA